MKDRQFVFDKQGREIGGVCLNADGKWDAFTRAPRFDHEPDSRLEWLRTRNFPTKEDAFAAVQSALSSLQST